MAKTRCKDPVSSETVRPVATGMKDKWGDSREGTSLSVTSEGEVGGGKSVPQRVFEASVWQCWQEGGHDTEAALRPDVCERLLLR